MTNPTTIDTHHKERRSVWPREVLNVVLFLLTIASIVWRGGEITESLRYVAIQVTELKVKVELATAQQAKDGTELRVVQERQQNHGDQLRNHEMRINALERKPDRYHKGD